GGLADGMRDLGYVEGETFAVEARYADGRVDRLPALFGELERLHVEAVVVTDTSALDAALTVTTLPVVMALGGNPVASGAVASMAQPGGNVTGLASATPS